jgi:hypothetical protein
VPAVTFRVSNKNNDGDITMKKLALAISALSAMGLSNLSQAVPVDPNDVNVEKDFTVEVQAQFNLFADSDDPNLVWYVPKQGIIGLLNPAHPNPRPRFSAYTSVPFTGLFAGQTLTYLGGAFSTTGIQTHLKLLEKQAALQGKRIAPAQAAKAETRFLLTGAEVNNEGRMIVDCTTEEYTNNQTGQTFTVPKCFVQGQEGQQLQTELFYKFRSFTPQGNSSVSQYIPFQAVSFPGVDATLMQLMQPGFASNLDAVVQAQTTWDLTMEKRINVARITIKWSDLVKNAKDYAQGKGYSLKQEEVGQYFQQVVQQQDQDQTGLKVEYINPENGQLEQGPVDQNHQQQVVQAVQQSLQKEVFAQVVDQGQSQLEQGQQQQSQYTLRANFGKLMMSNNEITVVSWNRATGYTQPTTNMTIDCLSGGFGTPVVWDNATPGCKELLETTDF